MKYFITFIFAAAVIFYSCGDDNTTNNSGTGGETVIFSMDSLVVITPVSVSDTTIYINNINRVRISFDCLTNADSINGFSSYIILASYIDSNNVYHEYLDTTYNRISSLNNTFNFYINTPNPYGLNIKAQCFRNNANIYFIKLKNIKIYQII